MNTFKTNDKKLRVLVISHGHPEFSKGGGEVAAYNLFTGLKEDPRVEACWFMGAKPNEPSGGISMLCEHEYIWRQAVRNAFLMKAAVPNSTLKDFTSLLKALRPNVIHFHHYVHVGLEALAVARRTCPDARILLTLHEMLAICLSDGQMVKRKNFALCYKSGEHACNQCFPEYSAEDFWLRKRYYMEHFAHVDQFISPSNFLKQRYVDWGLPAEQIHVIENGLPELGPVRHRPVVAGELRNRIGYFGQITLYKGVDVLLEALALLPSDVARKLSVEIHGANLESQKPEFQEKIHKLLDPLIENGVVRMMGAYSREELYKRLSSVDWLIIPSIWWENSPVVIQEAFSLGKPIIASDIGGMAEKVTDGVDGMHFSARSPVSLAGLLQRIVEGKIDWNLLSSNIQNNADFVSCTSKNIVFY